MTEITLHGARPVGAPHPRLGYAMVNAASTLFAVNGTVSKVILSNGGISSLRLTELRATGAFLGLAAFVLATAPGRLRVARSSVSRRLEIPPFVRITFDTVPLTAKSVEAAATIA